MAKRAIYICFEGLEGCFKTTNANHLHDFLIKRNFKVLLTKEPGTHQLPLTMELRKIMLDKQYDEQLTPLARECINIAIRSIHMEKLVLPAMEEYDFIIQDRGVLSGLAYGVASGNTSEFLIDSYRRATKQDNLYKLYDHIIYLYGDIQTNLDRAIACKKEFEKGDVMESRGVKFMTKVREMMEIFNADFKPIWIHIDNKSKEQIFNEILTKLDLIRFA